MACFGSVPTTASTAGMRLPTASPHHVRRSESGSALSSNDVTSFAEAPDGSIWVGTDGGGLNLWNRESGTFRHYQHDASDPESLGDNRIMSLLVDSSGVLWAGTFNGGLDRFDRTNETLSTLSSPRAGSDNRRWPTASRRSWKIQPASSGWEPVAAVSIATIPRPGRFTKYQNSESTPSSLSSDRIVDLYLDGEDILWVGTDGGGLNRLDRSRGQFTHFQPFRRQLGRTGQRSCLVDPRRHRWRFPG